MNDDGITREPIYAIWGKVTESDFRHRISLKLIGIIYKMHLDESPNCPDFVIVGEPKVGSKKSLDELKAKVREVMDNVEFVEYVRLAEQ